MKGMNVKMKKRILPIFLIIILIFTNYSIAVEYTREGGQTLDNIATKITDDLYLEDEYSAYTNYCTAKDIEIFDYESNVKKVNMGARPESNYKYFDESPSVYYVTPFPTTADYADGSRRLIGFINFKRKFKVSKCCYNYL